MTSQTMPAARMLAVGQRPQVVEIPVPVAGPGEVRIAVRACGICGSDVHIVHGTTPTGPLPLTLGHEASGVVESVGEGVSGWSPGDRVCVAAGYGCGTCPMCRSERVALCPQLQIPGIHRDGAQAPYLVVPAAILVALPDAVDFATGAVLTDAVATPYHAIKRAGVRAGDRVAVFGVGGLGLHAVSILTQVFGAEVVAVDVSESAAERARRFGATDVVVAREGVAKELRRRGAVDHAMEFVGDPRVVDQAVKSLRPGGTCTVVGVTPEPLVLLPQALLVAQELRLQGSFGSTLEELRELVDHVAAGRLDVAGTITHRYPLDRFDEALRTLETKEGDPVRVVVEQPA